jgi:hypothetical protein
MPVNEIRVVVLSVQFIVAIESKAPLGAKRKDFVFCDAKDPRIGMLLFYPSLLHVIVGSG